MQKKAIQFIDLLESKQLLSDEIVSELRKQVADSKTRLTPELLSRLLVDNGHLTKFQATKLVAELKQQTSQSDEEELGFAPEPEEEELGFAPEAEDSEQPEAETEEAIEVASVFADKPQPAPGEIEVVDVEVVDAEEVDDLDEVAETVQVVEAIPAEASADSAGEPDVLSAAQRATPKPVRPKQPTSTPWDSFRILGVGLILALTLVAGFFLLDWFIRGNAEERLAMANSSYEALSYETAANLYTEFAEDFPASEDVSFARVRAALATLRKDSEGVPDPTVGLETALRVLPGIESESSLGQLRPEVAGALISLASKFNERADNAQTTEERNQLMSEMQELMALIDDPRFVGIKEKNQQAPTLNRIAEDRQRILRNINRDEQLNDALQAIDNSLANQDTAQAYQIRKEVIGRYPSLEAAPELTARVEEASQIQQALVERGSLRPSRAEAFPTAGVGKTFVLGHRYGSSSDALRGQVIFVRVKGSVYGLNGEDGEILWRRYVGRNFQAEPIRLGETSDTDALITIPEQGLIARVAGRSGEERWVVDLDRPIHQPAVESEEVFVSCLDGQIVSLDVESGQTRWVTKLPQPVEIPPGLAFGKPNLYIPGEHSNLYVLSRSDGSCQEVYYLGHRPDSIAVPPKLLLGQLFVFENINAETAKIRILSTSDAGVELDKAQVPIVVDGNIFVKPQIDGRKMVVQSDLGQILVLDVEPTLETQKVSQLASIPKNLLQPRLSWCAFRNNQLWLTGQRFTKVSLQVSLGKLSRLWSENDGDTFMGPPRLAGDDMLVHTRQLRGNQGFRVAAVSATDGQPQWEVDLGVPISLLAQRSDRQVDAVNTSGALFALSGQTIQSSADANPGRGRPLMTFTNPVHLDDSSRVMLNASVPNQLALYSPESDDRRLRILSASFGGGKPTCQPVGVGQSVAIGLDNGQFLLFDPTNGSLAASAFQPPTPAGQSVTWNTPVYSSDSDTLTVASDLQKLVRLGTGNALRPLIEKDLEQALNSPLCQLAGNVAAVVSSRAESTLHLFDELSLEQVGRVPLAGALIAGPYSLEAGCLLQSTAGLVLISPEGKVVWQVEFPTAEILGPPTQTATGLLVITRSGLMWLLDPENGSVLAETDAGQSLSCTPIVTPQGILIGSDEGAVLALPIPTPAAEAR